MLWGVALLASAVAIVSSDVDTMRAGGKRRAAEFAVHGQAVSVAQAGLTDAYAWLRRQAVQPVTTFAPKRDLGATPPVNETDDPTIGLVREFEITSGIWGRYEVRRGRPMDPYTDVNQNGRYDDGEPFTDLKLTGAKTTDFTLTGVDRGDEFVAGRLHDGYGDGEWTPSRFTRDVSAERGQTAKGSVWRIESRGLVYRREREDLPLGADPNVLLASVVSTSEVRRLVMTPPANAAVCAPSAAAVTLTDRVRVRAPTLAFGFGATSGSLSIPSLGEVTAATRFATVPGYKPAIQDVFGVDFTQLKTMADVTTKKLSGVPETIKEKTLVVIERDMVYDREWPLKGGGALVVKGNLEIQSGSRSYFTGILYVDGNVSITAPAMIRGTIIATGGVTLKGSAGDYVEVEHDTGVVSKTLASLSDYRFMRAVYTPDRKLLDTALTIGDPWEPEPDPVGGLAPPPGGAPLPGAAPAPGGAPAPADAKSVKAKSVKKDKWSSKKGSKKSDKGSSHKSSHKSRWRGYGDDDEDDDDDRRSRRRR
jgi:hypothetical protein